MFYLSTLRTTIDDFDSLFVCALGYLNTDTVKGTDFGKELQSFCNDSRLVVADVLHLPTNSVTHVNDGYGTESWLDHIVCTKGFLDVFSRIRIDNTILSADHFPVCIKIIVQVSHISFHSTAVVTPKKWVVDWDSLCQDDLQAFESAVNDSLGRVRALDELLHCGGCSAIDHHDAIAEYYKQIIGFLREA